MKKIFLTGSGSGLGKKAAIALAKKGHTVYASVHYENEIESLEKIAKNQKLKLKAFKLDITKPEDRNLILKFDFDTFISNAAIGDSGSVIDVSVNRIRNVFDINVFHNLEIIQLALNNFINTGSGRIIIISSLVGRIPLPFLSPYCASKSALESFGTCLKNEIKILNKLNNSKIYVSLIEPGAYATGFNKENCEKKYTWMKTNSYFSPYVNLIHKYDSKFWHLIEKRSFSSIIKKYVSAVEDKRPHFRYYAPLGQAILVQLGRIIGL